MTQTSRSNTAAGELLLGDEAVAVAALDAGITAAYAYPGTPSTEILESLLARNDDPSVTVHWAANEKTSYEQALGVSMMGRRSLIAMKHVGLNVAMDPFINSALVHIDGGLVVAVADDPGMHSSQNEQDSRFLADFARVPCFEPASQQEVYAMTREAFDVSERFHVPIVVRLVTRLAHSRSAVVRAVPRSQNPLVKTADVTAWTLLPGNARRLWRDLLDVQPGIREYTAGSSHNVLAGADGGGVAVVTAGIARGYYLENLPDLDPVPPHLHIGLYPAPIEALRALAETADRILVIEEGYPYLERMLRGVLPSPWTIEGRESGALPAEGELTPDLVRAALGLPARPRTRIEIPDLPGRPPQLCQGCPHIDSYEAINEALGGYGESIVTADIGCYTLGALPPYNTIESCVCMGASIGMAKGASDAGLRPALAVIGDGTFLHSGVTGLMDAVAADTDMTLVILDNQTIAMTGKQPTILPDTRLEPIIRGTGVDPAHLHFIDADARHHDEFVALLRQEIDHPGLSVIVAVRACVEHLKTERRRARAEGEAGP
jgi:indolepyruvate ferredoxin oxidoreductase alpha subunit